MKFYPDEEEHPEYWWDVELEGVRYEVYSIEKDKMIHTTNIECGKVKFREKTRLHLSSLCIIA